MSPKGDRSVTCTHGTRIRDELRSGRNRAEGERDQLIRRMIHDLVGRLNRKWSFARRKRTSEIGRLPPEDNRAAPPHSDRLKVKSDGLDLAANPSAGK